MSAVDSKGSSYYLLSCYIRLHEISRLNMVFISQYVTVAR